METLVSKPTTALNMDSEKSLNTGKSSSVSEQSSILHSSMLKNLGEQQEMVDKLRFLKNSNDLKYYESNGALEVDFPSNITDVKLDKLSKQVSDIDSIYNNRYSAYKELEKSDLSLNGNNHNKVCSSLSAQHNKAYKNLFEK